MANDELEDLTGQIFEDRDTRMGGRRIQILSKFEKRDPWNRPYPAYRVISVGYPGSLNLSVGNKSTIGAGRLEKFYRKVNE